MRCLLNLSLVPRNTKPMAAVGDAPSTGRIRARNLLSSYYGVDEGPTSSAVADDDDVCAARAPRHMQFAQTKHRARRISPVRGCTRRR